MTVLEIEIFLTAYVRLEGTIPALLGAEPSILIHNKGGKHLWTRGLVNH